MKKLLILTSLFITGCVTTKGSPSATVAKKQDDPIYNAALGKELSGVLELVSLAKQDMAYCNTSPKELLLRYFGIGYDIAAPKLISYMFGNLIGANLRGWNKTGKYDNKIPEQIKTNESGLDSLISKYLNKGGNSCQESLYEYAILMLKMGYVAGTGNLTAYTDHCIQGVSTFFPKLKKEVEFIKLARGHCLSID